MFARDGKDFEFELNWAKFDMKFKLNSPSKYCNFFMFRLFSI
jgi:hypothetical protein